MNRTDDRRDPDAVPQDPVITCAPPVTQPDPLPGRADRGPRCRRRILAVVSGRWVMWGVAAALASVAAFAYLDPIIAAFVTIMLTTAVTLAVLARDWDRHSSYEERELERARRRAARWERGKDARERDRAKWEAHQARQTMKKQATRKAAHPEQ